MVIQVLNTKLGITLRVSVTSVTILTAKRTIHKNTYLSLKWVSYRDAFCPSQGTHQAT